MGFVLAVKNGISLSSFTELLKGSHEYASLVYMCFVDMEEACDYIPQSTLYRVHDYRKSGWLSGISEIKLVLILLSIQHLSNSVSHNTKIL